MLPKTHQIGQQLSMENDVYRNAKYVIKAVHSEHEELLQNNLASQLCSTFSYLFENCQWTLNSILSKVNVTDQKISNSFTIRYLNNFLWTHSNFGK